METASAALSRVPAHLRDELLEHFLVAQEAAALRDWEKVGLRAGKLCETAYCILEGHCTGSYPVALTKPKDMQAACRALESKTATNASRSARVQIPRVIAATYELRNNRSIGHAGGDVRPNQMDGLFFDQALKWIVCELIRLYSELPLETATATVAAISTRWTPAVWESGGRKRAILDGASVDDRILVLLHYSDGQASLSDLRDWLGSKNITHLRDRHVLKLHEANFVDFDAKSKRVSLLPKGVKRVEEHILAAAVAV